MAKVKSLGIISLLLLAMLAARPAVAQPADEASPQPFSPGETLTYDVSWSIFRAGQVTATLGPAQDRSQDAYEIVTQARSQGFVSLLFNVENEFRSLVDPHTLCSHQIHKTINEGRRHKDTRIVFDSARNLAVLDEVDKNKPDAPPKHAENAIPGCVADVVTAFYYVRKQPLRVGESFRLPINDGAKTYDVTVEVQAREQIETPLGKRDAFRVEPKVFGALFARKGRMLIWFSDDARRLPLRISASIAVGSITGTLRSVTPAPAAMPAPR
jgi:hypothetical protein